MPGWVWGLAGVLMVVGLSLDRMLKAVKQYKSKDPAEVYADEITALRTETAARIKGIHDRVNELARDAAVEDVQKEVARCREALVQIAERMESFARQRPSSAGFSRELLTLLTQMHTEATADQRELRTTLNALAELLQSRLPPPPPIRSG